MNLFRQVTSIAGCVILVSSLSGCCVPKGYMIGGDWSIQLNRIPWVEHSAACEGCQETECLECCPPGPTPAMTGDPPMVGRLHPVPTRPAFAQRTLEPGVVAPAGELRIEDYEELPPPRVSQTNPTGLPVRPKRLARTYRPRDTSNWIFSLPF